ncbi:glycosyltransferase [Phenylobacterium sp.]|uniref:glycosyltransferase n=1 Tax=Phenylobacterium sp. TaxID=1871053 RepID=UPI00356B148F
MAPAVSDMSATPLVSVIVVAYKQEPYVRAAVRSALAQTYAPLEIVLSDDCSSDRTFEIMQEEAQAYTGPHKIILNRNPTNLGVAQHYNRAAGLASGDLIVVQDGDDISRSDRVAKLARAALEPTPVDMVCSNVSVIDGEGKALPKWGLPPVVPMTLEGALNRGSISALGCASAYSRSLWTKYGPIDAEVLQEDVVLPFRALLERGIRVVDEQLVEYRVHDANLFAGRKPPRGRESRRRWARSWRAISRDWRRAWSLSGRDDAAFEQPLGRRMKLQDYDVECYDRSRIYALLAALRGLAEGLTLRNSAGIIKRHVFRLA